MLGKGLESLIPQKGDQDGNINPQVQPGQPQPGQQSQPAKQNHMQHDPPPQIWPNVDAIEHAETVREEISSKLAEHRPDQAVSRAPAPNAHIPIRSGYMPPSPQTAHSVHPTYPVQQKPAEDARPKKETLGDADRVFHIEVEKIKPNPDQPRRNFNQDGLRDLANSIREFGILQPLVVSRVGMERPDGLGVEYQLIAGERRFLAAKMLGLHAVPVIVRNVSLEREKLELAVIENIQRENLNPIETARAFQRLQEEFKMTQREIAAKLGKSREVVANTMRLLDLPEYLQVAVQRGEISESNARFLLGVQDPGAQQRLFDDVVQNKLTTRDVRARVDQLGGGAGAVTATGGRRGRPPKTEARLSPELKAMQESLSSDLGAPVEINKGASKGAITITFYSEEELENILRRLGKE